MSADAIATSMQPPPQDPIQSETQEQSSADTSQVPSTPFPGDPEYNPSKEEASPKSDANIPPPDSTTTLMDKSDKVQVLPSTTTLINESEESTKPRADSSSTLVNDTVECVKSTAAAIQSYKTPVHRNWSPPFPLNSPVKRRPIFGIQPAKPTSLADDFLWQTPTLTGLIVRDYEITRTLSSDGAHGLLVLGRHKQTGSYHAMKIERQARSMGGEGKTHSKIYEKLKGLDDVDIVIPRLHAVYKVECGKEITVMDVLGPSLAELRTALRHKAWSMKTSLQVGLELLGTYEQLHSVGWVHLTTKPHNFCIGGTPTTQRRIYAVDFGRARAFLTADETHVGEYKLGQQVYVSYASTWSEKEIAGSRRDDLMSLTLMMVDLAYGSVPWNSGRKSTSKIAWIENAVKGGRCKKLAPFQEMLAYIAKLEYTDKPDYDGLRGLLRLEAERKGILLDGVFEWEELLDVNEEGFVIVGKKMGRIGLESDS